MTLRMLSATKRSWRRTLLLFAPNRIAFAFPAGQLTGRNISAHRPPESEQHKFKDFSYNQAISDYNKKGMVPNGV